MLIDMLELSKAVLSQLSIDKELFAKELRKFLNWLNESDTKKLQIWCYEKFGHIYGPLLKESFV
jgi:hypothetical protein